MKGKRGVIPIGGWPPGTLMKAQRRAAELLEGVGTGQDYWSRTDHALQLRRRLSDAEIAGLDPAWLAIPAVDPG